MLAAYHTRYGTSKVLSVKEVATPIPQEGEVLVKVYATTVNRTDCAIVTGWPLIMRLFQGLSKPKQTIPGTDFAGTIEALGPNVTSFAVGDRVWGFKDGGLASQAEYLCMPADGNIGSMPADTSFEEAAASLEGAHYAINMLNKVEHSAGQKVMINGACGAIGSALLQVCKEHGLYVTATAKTSDLERVKALGADRIIDYTQQDFTADEERYDYVFDSVGKSTFGDCKRLLTDKGIYISSELGPGWQNIYLALFTPIFDAQKVIFPIPTDVKRSMAIMKELLENGRYQPLIDRSYPLNEVAAAYAYVLTGQKTGNVILQMPVLSTAENS